MRDTHKSSVQWTEEELAELRAEAKRLGRSVSYVVQTAWKLARAELRRRPAQKRTP